MNTYIKGDKVIMATEKAYNIIYKEQGFMPQTECELGIPQNEDGGGVGENDSNSRGDNTDNFDEDKKSTARRKSADK